MTRSREWVRIHGRPRGSPLRQHIPVTRKTPGHKPRGSDCRQTLSLEKASQSFSPRKAKNQSNPFFPRTCASEKTLLSPEVCERLSTRVRALGCSPSVGKACQLCRQQKARGISPGVLSYNRFAFSQTQALRTESMWRVRSSILLEKPHSLSYQATNFTK